MVYYERNLNIYKEVRTMDENMIRTVLIICCILMTPVSMLLTLLITKIEDFMESEEEDNEREY